MNWYFASGDLDFFWPQQLRALSWLPQVFRPDQGFGTSSLLSLWLDYPFRVILKLLSTLGLSWFFIEKLLWVSVFILAAYSSYKLAKNVLAPILYATNTYVLLLFSGGQLGVAFAYALAPLVLLKFIEKDRIANGLWLALLVACDLRIAYLVVGAVVLYLLVEKRLSSLWSLGVSLFVAASVHLYWILPTVLTGIGPRSLGQDFVNPAMLKFFSFADFSHALSLLHPNWPENLFGKVYFLQPEFLVLPILAFSALLFRDKKMRYFAVLSLIGAFFAKGVNDPAGGIFQWMFSRVPGFVMFRDPTKFYLFTAIGYSVLIPYVLKRINKKLIVIIFIIFWIFTIRDMRVNVVQLSNEYVQLKNMLVSDTTPSRTLWIPVKEKFAFSSDIHPIVTASTSAFIDTSVKYVIVPQDVSKRIFLNDYKFDPLLRTKLVDDLSETRLKRVSSFHDIAVFENPDFSGMRLEIPPIVEKQQRLANIGLGVSAVFLIVWIIWRKL